MNYAVYNIALDIHKTGSQVALSMIRGENKRKIVISLTENGRPYKITDGITAAFTAKKPDNKFIYNDCEIDIENNLIIYNITSQTTAAMGMVDCQLKLIGSDGGLLFSPNFSLVVADTLYNEEPIVASSEEFNALTNYIANLEKKLADGEFKGDKGDTGDAGKDADVSTLSPAIVCTEKGTAIAVSDSSESTFKGLNIFGRSIQNGTPTPDAPIDIVSVGDDGDIVAGVKDGTNIFATSFSSGSIDKDTGADISDPTIQRTGYLTSGENKVYCVNGNGGPLRVFFYDTNKVLLSTTFLESGYWFATPATCAYVRFQISTAGYNSALSVNMVDAVTISNISLHAIPVTDSSLATYTDANGKMWCADEIDLERGVYIQRVKKLMLDECTVVAHTQGSYRVKIPDATTDTIFYVNNKCICSHLPWVSGSVLFENLNIEAFSLYYEGDAGMYVRVLSITNVEEMKNWLKGVTFIYRLQTPIETPLTSEQIAAYKALKTNYPSTTILNDENAFMKVSYRADTKNFVQKMVKSVSKISSVTLSASKWVGTASPYSQVVTIPGATKNSKIDLNPTVEQLSIFHNKDLAFVVGNNNGTITVYCIGQKPTNDYTMQVTITEVAVNA